MNPTLYLHGPAGAPAAPPPADYSLPPAEAATLLAWLQRALRPPVEPCSWPSLEQGVQALYSPPHRAKKTWLQYRQVIRELRAAADQIAADDGREGSTPADVDERAVATMISASQQRGNSADRTNALLRTTKSLTRWMASKRYIAADPFAGRDWWLWTEDKESKAFDLDVVARVLAEADRRAAAAQRLVGWHGRRRRHFAGRLRTLVATLAYCGLRLGEALHLQWSDVDWREGVLWIRRRRSFRGKTKSATAPVGMPARLAEVLGEWRDAGGGRGNYVFAQFDRDAPWTSGGSGRRPLDAVKRLGLAVGAAGFNPKSLRHTWATNGEGWWGLSELQIQRQLRHSSPKTQQHYRKAHLANLRAIAGKIEFKVVDRDGRRSAVGLDAS